MSKDEERLTRAEWLAEYRATENKRFGCVDCGAEDRYMLVDAVWRKAFPDYHEVRRRRLEEDPTVFTNLCMMCVEKRLGRTLTINDFVEYPINKNIFWGYRLAMDKLQKL